HLHLVVGGQRQLLVGGAQFDIGFRALEVVALAGFLARLVQGVVDFREIDRRGDVEGRGRGHVPILAIYSPAGLVPCFAEWRARASSTECDSVMLAAESASFASSM